jgi:hypothetical protein
MAAAKRKPAARRPAPRKDEFHWMQDLVQAIFMGTPEHPGIKDIVLRNSEAIEALTSSAIKTEESMRSTSDQIKTMATVQALHDRRLANFERWFTRAVLVLATYGIVRAFPLITTDLQHVLHPFFGV